MLPKLTFAAPAVLALGLASGCQTLSSPAVVDTLAKVCRVEPLAYAAFQIFAPRASLLTVARVNQAHAVVTSICMNPPTNVANAFFQAFTAYMVIQGATP